MAEFIKIEDLKPHPENPREHTEEQIQKIAKSIHELDWGRPIIISKDNYILAGEGAYLAAKNVLKYKEVPFRRMKHMHDSPEAIAYMLADNKLNEESDWNYGKLQNIKNELGLLGFDASLTGFNEIELQEIDTKLDANKTEVKDDDFNPDEETESICKLGDIWKLGDHRLMCGDSTKKKDVNLLMDGKLANMVFTDPPYNVDYGSTKNPQGWSNKPRKIKNDKMGDNDWKEFNQKLIDIIKEFCIGDMYIWGAPGHAGIIQRLLFIESGIHWSSTLIWFKDHFVFGRSNYQRIYEPCFYGWINKSSFRAGRKETEVWENPRPKNSELHPTMKPVELCGKAIKNSSLKEDIILDLFGGSGSTLIACEQLDRVCYMVELDPHYCDIIINRWEEFTGKTAKKY